MKFMFRISGVIKIWNSSGWLWHWWSKFDYRYDRIRICFSNLILWALCEKTDEGKAESIILILVLVLSSSVSVKSFTFESFKPFLSLFLTIEGKWQLDLSFSLSARFQQLNAAQKLSIFKFLFLFYFVDLLHSISPVSCSTAVFNCPP